jgi:hypothetical protein
MYINTPILKSKNLSLQEFSVLCLIRQQKFENNTEILESEVNGDILGKFTALGLVEYVSRKNKAQKELDLIRTSKKGNEWIDDINTADVCEDTLKIYNWVENIYLSTNREIGNKKRTKQFIAQFSKESSITRNHLAFLIQSFINTESEFDWSKKLQFLFFKGESLFSVRFDLHSSRLYQFYLKQENYFLEQFSKIKND